jgi:hypothetical protein
MTLATDWAIFNGYTIDELDQWKEKYKISSYNQISWGFCFFKKELQNNQKMIESILPIYDTKPFRSVDQENLFKTSYKLKN